MMKVPFGVNMIEDEEIRAVTQVMETGRLRQGDKVAEFEAALAGFMGTRYAVATSSGTSALHLLYRSVLNKDNAIAIPNMTFGATLSAVPENVECHIIPTELRSQLISLEHLHDCLSKNRKIRAVCVVDLFGATHDTITLKAICSQHRVLILHDSAQAFGTVDANLGLTIAQVGDAACFSFYPSKIMTTGEGGAICTDNPIIYAHAKSLREHGIVQGMKHWYACVNGYRGGNFRMTEMQAAIGLEQLRKVEGFIHTRRKIAKRYNKEFQGLSKFAPQEIHENIESCYNLYTLRLKRFDREMTIKACERLNEMGTMSRWLYPNMLSSQPMAAFNDTNIRIGHQDFNDFIVLAIPIHHKLTWDEVEHVVKTVKEVDKTL